LIVLRIPPKPSDVAAGIQNALQLAIDLRAAAFVVNAGPTPVGGKPRGSNPWER
jgi:P pilus assembly chaperone PapD